MATEAVIFYNLPNDCSRSDIEALISPVSVSCIELRVLGHPEKNRAVAYLTPGSTSDVVCTN